MQQPNHMHMGDSPTDLIQRSKQKFVLSQARLRQGQIELTLLSLHGSLDDGLRAYLHLHGHAIARDDWPSLIAALRADEEHPLTRDEADQLQRIYTLWMRISCGEAVTLAEESAAASQRVAASLLLRYGVLVVAPDEEAPASSLAARLAANATPPRWRHYQWVAAKFAPLVLTLIGGIIVLILLIPPLMQVLPWSDETASAPTQSSEAAGGGASATQSTSSRLAPGRVAVVRARMEERDVALRAEPGTAADNPIRLYLAPGTAVRILEGPVVEGGTEWWKVRAVNQQGWCPADALEAS
jgi:hypothetical protein